jgi:antitoxin (DNA-binding transcriptional repressor) of toxin-antitoxin stability system
VGEAERAASSEELRRTERGRQVVAAQRDALVAGIAALPSAWMSIPGWARWFRRGYRLLGRDLARLGPRRRS